MPGVSSRQRLLVVRAVRAGPLRVGDPRPASRWVALGVGVAVALVAADLSAQDRFEAAERARAEARLDEAEAAYEAVLSSGELGLSEVAHAHLRLAELSFLGEELEAGTRHLRYALSLRPDAPVDDGPQAMRDAAAAILVERSQRTLRAVLEVSDPSAPIVVDVRDAPEGLVRTLTLRGGEDWSRTVSWDSDPISVHPPAAARPIGVRLFDRYGNTLGSAGVWPAPVAAVSAPVNAPPSPAEVAAAAVPTPTQPAPTQPAPADSSESSEGEGGDNVLENPWFWAAIGVVVVIAVVAVAFTASGESFTLGPPVAPSPP